MLCIPIFGMLGVSRETTPFWYEIHTFVLTVQGKTVLAVTITAKSNKMQRFSFVSLYPSCKLTKTVYGGSQNSINWD